MTNRKHVLWMISAVLVVGLLVGMASSFQPAQAVSSSPASEEPLSIEVGDSPTSTGPVCTATDMTDAIAHWDLDETSGMLFDDAIDAHDGTCSGDACPSPVPGTTAGGQFFIETDDDYISVATSTDFDLTNASDFSVGAWVKTSQDCAGNKVFIGRYDKDNGSWWLGCVPDTGSPGDGLAAFHMRDSDGIIGRAVSSTPINDGRWHYVVGVRNGTTGDNDIFVDGLSEDPISPGFTGDFVIGHDVTIGAYTFPGYYFNGTLDDVALFSTALADSDMASCAFDINVGDVTFDVEYNTPLDITEGQLLANSSGGVLSLDSFAASSEKGGTVTGTDPYTYTPPTDYAGTDFFTFIVSDGTNTAPGTAILIQTKPGINDPGDQIDDEGDVISLQIEAVDPNGDDLTYEATNLPDGLSIDPDSGLISGTISYTASVSSPYDPVTVTVTDTDTNSSFVEFMWTVNDVNVPPDVTDLEDQVSEEGEVISLPVVADDPDGDTLTYNNIAPDLLPPPLSIDPNTGLISGTIAAGASTGSPYTVTIGVSDGVNPAVEITFEWAVVLEINDPPVVTQPADREDTEGDVVSLQIEATDPDGDPLTYSESVTNPLPDGLSINSSGLISGTIADDASASSPYTVTIEVSDGVNPAEEVTFTWTVLAKAELNKIYLPLVIK
jgi:hypothetical protein